jgi:hypothetical protein
MFTILIVNPKCTRYRGRVNVHQECTQGEQGNTFLASGGMAVRCFFLLNTEADRGVDILKRAR